MTNINVEAELTDAQLDLLAEKIASKMQEQQRYHGLPPNMRRRQFMEEFDVNSTRASELFQRPDFPIIDELGHPRVNTKLLFEWMDAHTRQGAIHGLRDPRKQAI